MLGKSTMTDTDKTWRNFRPDQAEAYNFDACWTRNHLEDPIRKIDLVAALYLTRANLFKVAILLRRTRKQISAFLDRNPDVQEIRYEIFDSTLDQIESDTITSALAGDGQDRRFVLSTLGKDRGYSTRAQVTGKGDGPVAIEKIEWEIVDPKVRVPHERDGGPPDSPVSGS